MTVLRYVVYLVIVVAVRVHAPVVAHRPMASMKRVFSPMRPSITSTRADETSSPHSPPRQMKRTDDGGYGGEEDEEIMDGASPEQRRAMRHSFADDGNIADEGELISWSPMCSDDEREPDDERESHEVEYDSDVEEEITTSPVTCTLFSPITKEGCAESRHHFRAPLLAIDDSGAPSAPDSNHYLHVEPCIGARA